MMMPPIRYSSTSMFLIVIIEVMPHTSIISKASSQISLNLEISSSSCVSPYESETSSGQKPHVDKNFSHELEWSERERDMKCMSQVKGDLKLEYAAISHKRILRHVVMISHLTICAGILSGDRQRASAQAEDGISLGCET